MTALKTTGNPYYVKDRKLMFTDSRLEYVVSHDLKRIAKRFAEGMITNESLIQLRKDIIAMEFMEFS